MAGARLLYGMGRDNVLPPSFFARIDAVRQVPAWNVLLIVFFFKQKTAYEIGLGIPAEPLFRSRGVAVSCGESNAADCNDRIRQRRTDGGGAVAIRHGPGQCVAAVLLCAH
eukprot:TRINITY_DN94654_c0_g1_i1.p1 TRINITY_DN94654_c0_g1~~TRINITY_DN94654_c0_g1_i1.p1  ORF type:complete len:111 (-),score=19.35 TRINITY_DN94654_c0_g1_i1:146-478(-)